jgi:hypothetical protein
MMVMLVIIGKGDMYPIHLTIVEKPRSPRHRASLHADPKQQAQPRRLTSAVFHDAVFLQLIIGARLQDNCKGAPPFSGLAKSIIEDLPKHDP